jgi:type I restriction enzyme R subunit
MRLAGDSHRNDKLFFSQIPALRLLIGLGYHYLTPAEALRARGGRSSNLLLEDILSAQLKALNRIRHKDELFHFSEENIQSAVQLLKNVKHEGLLKTNEAVFDLLTLGKSLEQTLEGSRKSFTLQYIDWRNPANNVFHVTAEFDVERTRSHETLRVDIVLFVNGIPLAVIECNTPRMEIGDVVAQSVRNQQDERIARFYAHAHMALAVNSREARYATIGTSARFWSAWKEAIPDIEIDAILERGLPGSAKLSLFDLAFGEPGARQELTPYTPPHRITEQDRLIYALCRPERLLEVIWRFTVFDGGVRKIARHQQYFAITKVLQRVKEQDEHGVRRGGIVWHTQGSGKSITMVMLARALLLDADIPNPRVLLVSDRQDLDSQLGNTFAACGLTPDRAESGRHLLELVADPKSQIITTLIQKFDKALSSRKLEDPSTEIFVLVDESHRSNYGAFAARMRQMFPRACYLGFTGTPLLSSEKNSLQRFGGLIDSYPIRAAVEDGAVVPLLYEARHIEAEADRDAIDHWFASHTSGLTDTQRAQLKRKFSRSAALSQSDRVTFMRALDISEHFRANWQGIAKAQLVAATKRAALKYKQFLDEIGQVASEVIISAPEESEGVAEHAAEADDDNQREIVAFWKDTMKRFGNEEEYNQQIVKRFKLTEKPEMLIVVDKLLTGFDAPSNTVLYLTRTLRQHTLLQAIARVNRLYDGDGAGRSKEFGYVVDYAGVLGELDRALTAYDALAGFDEDDLRGSVSSIHTEIDRLAQRHQDLWALFDDVQRIRNEQDHERYLVDGRVRASFYERLADYGRSLSIALSSEAFNRETPPSTIQLYKDDLRRFHALKTTMKLRYQEMGGIGACEARIRKLLDDHVGAKQSRQLHKPVDIFDEKVFDALVEAQGRRASAGAQADLIAHATKRAVADRIDSDPAFFGKFSGLIQATIDDFRAKRISDAEYLMRASQMKDDIVGHGQTDIPAELADRADEAALYRALLPLFRRRIDDAGTASTLAVQTSIYAWQVIVENWHVCFWDDIQAQRDAMNDIDDYLYDVLKDRHGVEMTSQEMDEVIDRSLKTARQRRPA